MQVRFRRSPRGPPMALRDDSSLSTGARRRAGRVTDRSPASVDEASPGCEDRLCMNRRTIAVVTMFAGFAVASVATAGSTRDTSTLPPGTYETKITTADLNRAGLHPEDA